MPESINAPRASDLAFAQRITDFLLALGDPRVRSIWLIGSRATGKATASSDFDLVVIMERAHGTPPWGGAEAMAEGVKLKRAVGDAFGDVEISVRSGEQNHEARGVFGGVEWLIDHEGIELYSRPFERAPSPSRSKENVQRALVRTWIEASSRSLTEGLRLHAESANLTAPRSTPRLAPGAAPAIVDGRLRIVLRHASARGTQYYWRRGLQQSVTALRVFYQLPSSKHDSHDMFVTHLRRKSRAHGDAAMRAVGLGVGPQGCLAMLEVALTVVPAAERTTGSIGRIVSGVKEWRKLISLMPSTQVENAPR